MQGKGAFARRGQTAIMLALLLCALFARALVPAGWMPAIAGEGYTITLCTGAGAMSVWVDGDGQVHKQKPSNTDRTDQPCSFAGFLNAATLPDMVGAPVPFLAYGIARIVLPVTTLAIGRGLAAPPPPPTGPPATL
ncbi:hypothetical protein [Sphingobium algorifonticola]|uniref:DUF2946 domain-containing protein n=1 Tax=Sphingobium algorifonticola TaxID=2008318 RepID=A0A437JCP9_9SPHN|nr:hypothetical protein [Sphingobium algorifonticola]RVT43689.1 hypothetical protein ENE74_03530 [Sphingobium algorifonticola]